MTPTTREILATIREYGDCDIDILDGRFPDYGRVRIQDRMRGLRKQGYVTLVESGVWRVVPGKEPKQDRQYTAAPPIRKPADGVSLTQTQVLDAAIKLREFRLCEIVDFLEAYHAKSYVQTALTRLSTAGLLLRLGPGEYRTTGAASSAVPRGPGRPTERASAIDPVVQRAHVLHRRLNGQPVEIFVSHGTLHLRRTCSEAYRVGEFTKATPLDAFVTACKVAAYRQTRGVGKPRVVGTDLKGVSV